MFMFVDVLKVNSASGITFSSLVPNIRVIHLEHHTKVLMLFLMPHYMLWIRVYITVVFSCILESLPLK